MEAQTVEKRHFPRVKIKTPLRYQVRGAHEFDNSVSEDLSLGGISFTHHKFIAPLTTLMLEVNILSRILNPIAQVAWASPMAHSDKYRLGLEFLEMDNTQKNYLKDYIDMQRGTLLQEKE